MVEGLAPQVTIRHVSKRFGGVQALDDVGFEILPGTIHALLGENGAGKSTLVKILSGAERADEGEILIRGQDVAITSPSEARRLGISVVHQELSLFPDLTVRSNVFAGRELAGPLGLARNREMEREVRRVMADIGWHINLSVPVQRLTLAERQMVEILRAVHQQADLIILDEPNSALTDRETHALFTTMERMRAAGHAFLLVSHRLDEVFATADRVTILRDGRHVATLPREHLDMRRAIVMMVGENQAIEAAEERSTAHHPEEAVSLEVRDLGDDAFQGVSFAAHRGEILGFAGLEGSGVHELLGALFGLVRVHDGEILLDGERYVPHNPREAVKQGIASIPADRKDEGLAMERSVAQNASLVVLRRIANRLGFITDGRIDRAVRPLLAGLRVRTPSISAPVTQLSGGNQQKVVLAKWLAGSPKILILNDPTRGVDVGAKSEVHSTVRRLADTGITILMWSSDAAETLELCDRILVLRDGRLVQECDPSTATLNELLLYTVGEEQEDATLQLYQEQEELARAGLNPE